MSSLDTLRDSLVALRNAIYARLHDNMEFLVRMRLGSCHLRAAALCDRTMDGSLADENPAYAAIIPLLDTATRSVPRPKSTDTADMIAMIGRASAALQRVELLP